MSAVLRPTPRAVARALVVLLAFRVLAGIAVGYPVARTFGAFLPQGIPGGDILVFEPGGLYLMEALRLGRRATQAALEGSSVVLLLVAISAVFPFAVALHGFCEPAESLSSLASRGARSFAPLVALGGALALLQGVGLVAIAAAVNGLSGAVDASMDERSADLCLGAGALLAGLPLLALGIVHDLARAAVIVRRTRATDALFVALGAFRAAPMRAIGAWLPPALTTALLVGGAAVATATLDVSKPGAGRVVAVIVVHQATVLAAVALRLTWLSRAMNVVGPKAPCDEATSRRSPLSETASPADTPERSGAPDDPTPDPVA